MATVSFNQNYLHLQPFAPISTQYFKFHTQPPDISHPPFPYPTKPAYRTTSATPVTSRQASSGKVKASRPGSMTPFKMQVTSANRSSSNMVPSSMTTARTLSSKPINRPVPSRHPSKPQVPSRHPSKPQQPISRKTISFRPQFKRSASVVTSRPTVWLQPKSSPSKRPATTSPSHYRAKIVPSKSKSTISKLEVISSKPDMEITGVCFTCNESAVNHTERLHSEDTEVIVRRGNQLILTINTNYVLDYDCVVGLTFFSVFRPRDKFAQFKTESNAKTMKLGVSLGIPLPFNFPVGKYHAHIYLSLSCGTDIITYFHHKAIVILFNPWNPLDDAYMEDASQREAYLEQDVGTIWRGTDSCKTPIQWEYGQYEEPVLDVALYLLRDMSADQCISAVHVCRSLVAQLNSKNQSGVLVESSGGRGPGNHVGGIHPSRWTGSTPILSRYYHTRSPVRFGQCWVFAGVAVSLLRVLGVATRPVTCYNAAHSCKKLGQVERFFASTGNLLHSLSRDQLWVYHVWCEAWMRRDDLPDGYSGWQVLDPTSQSRQSGHYRAGPSSVRAIKEGLGSKKWRYDNQYIISEVDADVCYVRTSGTNNFCKPHNQMNIARVNRGEVGTSIVTSSYEGDSEHKPFDVTSLYKNKTAIKKKRSVPSFYTDKGRTFPSPSRDCNFYVETSGGVHLGEELSVSVSVVNKGAMLRTMDGKVVGSVVLYTGEPICNFMTMEFSGIISAGQNATVSVPMDAKKYMRGISEQCLLQFFIAVKARETKQLFLKVHHVQLGIPELHILCAPSISEGTMLRVKISFTNTLLCTLSRLLFFLQGQSLCPHRELSYKKLVFPGNTATVECIVYPSQTGSFTLLASLCCDQLTDIRGQTKVTVHSR